MLVAHVYKDCYPPVAGGIEKHLHAIRSSGSKHEHEVIVCARSIRGCTVKTPWGVERRVGELGRLLSTPLAPAMPAALRASGAHLLHFHMPNPTGELASFLANGRPYVASYHADIVRQAFALPLYRLLVKRFLTSASAVVVASQAVLRTSPLLRNVEHATVIPYGVDTDRLSRDRVFPEKINGLRARYGSSFVLAVGRLVYYKGFDVLIDATTRGLQVPVVIVGEGPWLEQLEARARALGVNDSVHLVGRLCESDLHAHYAAASVFVLPSTVRAEAFGIATAEAQSFGLPVVVTELGTGTTEAMAPGLTGRAVRPSDADALAKAVTELLSEETRLEASQAARQFAQDRLSIRSMIDRLDALYERIARTPS